MLSDGSKEFGIDLTQEQLDKFSKYAGLLVEWNEKMNLTAITDEEGIVIKHFLDSLSLFIALPEKANSLIDVGTGAGFPGIPVKIVRDNMNVTLLDSLEKRIKFLNEVCSALSLNDIKAVHGRAEDFGIDKKYRESFEAATARGVAPLPVLLEYCLPFVKVGGYFLAMKGPDAMNEIKESKNALDVLGGEVLEAKKFKLPFSDIERCIVIVRKYRHTPQIYPRKSGKPTKNPL